MLMDESFSSFIFEWQKLLELEIYRESDPLLLVIHLQQSNLDVPHVHKLVTDKNDEVGIKWIFVFLLCRISFIKL